MKQKTSHVLDINERKKLILNQIISSKDKTYDDYCLRVSLGNISLKTFFETQQRLIFDSNSHQKLNTIESDINRIIECRAYF